MLLRRIQRLSPEDRDLLELAAVEGDAFEFDLLVTGSGLPRTPSSTLSGFFTTAPRPPRVGA